MLVNIPVPWSIWVWEETLPPSPPGTLRREIFTTMFRAETAVRTLKIPKKMAEINAPKIPWWIMTWSIEFFFGVFPHFRTRRYIYLQTSPCKLQKPQRGSAGFSTVAPRFQSPNSCSWRQLLMTRPEVCLEIVDRSWCVSCDGLGCFRPSLFDGRFVLGTACGTQGTRELWHHRMYQWKSCGRRVLSKIILDNVAYHPAKGCSIPYPHSCWLPSGKLT